jgi:hypothetical protein
MPDPSRLVADALRDAPGAAALLDRWSAARAIGELLAPLVQPLGTGFDLRAPGRCDLRDGVLWITAGSAAEAAKLRQTAPRLISALTARGYQVYEMKTRVQAVGSSYPGQGTREGSSSGEPFAAASETGIRAIETATATLPDSALRTALTRLARTLRRRRGQGPV